MAEKTISVEEISRHASADDCWIVVDGTVWDMTGFIHPGGNAIILKYAGRDATAAYNEIHSPSVLPENLDPSKNVGTLDKSTITDEWAKPPPTATPELSHSERPPLPSILNTHDFEEVASRTLSPKTWAFYSSAATDCLTLALNKSLLDRVWLRPRILRNVRAVSTTSHILGHPVRIPLFVSPAALARLAHPEGEKAMARACVAQGIVQCISTNASFPVAEILAETPEGQPSFFQLYVNSERGKTEALLKQVMELRPRIAGIVITVDAPVPGKREADERLKADESLSAPNSGAAAKNDNKGGGLGRIMGSYIDASLCWEDLAWIRGIVGSEMPLLLKGIQGASDARLAMKAGLQGIIVSNHGARGLDTSTPSIMILLELQRYCPEVFDAMEVWIDGGIRRGTDILKCLALGATAVGLGRPVLYAVNYGQEGVEHLVELLKDELETTMKLMGVSRLEDLNASLLNTRDVDHLVPDDSAERRRARRRQRARL